MRSAKISWICARLAVGLLVTSHALAAPMPWFIDESKLEFVALPGATAYWGVHANAGYQAEVPDDWNGSLVMYAHGFRGTDPELTVSMPRIREHLIASGFAWAASSYRANDYVPGIGAEDTHTLVGKVSSLIGQPSRVYITGHSMGGHITGLSIEQWPNTYDGALPMCGVMGDSTLFDYYQDIYLVAETLIGNEPAIPSPADYAVVGAEAAKAEMAPGTYPFVLTPTGETFKAVIENLTGGDRPTFDESFEFGPNGGNFIFLVAGTGDGRENVDTVYQFDSDPALSPEEQAFNDAIVRLVADPQFRRREGLGPYPGTRAGVDSPPITGEIGVPVLSIHTIGELFVPFHMQQVYARRVQENGASDLLVLRGMRDVLHCGFTLEEEARAFDDLVNWVENGVRPEGEDVLDPEVVADPNFGCAFTEGFSPFRLFLPPCDP
jgi:hypothetical protein